MVASRNRPKGGRQPPFGLGILMVLLLTSEVGRGDLAAVTAREPLIALKGDRLNPARPVDATPQEGGPSLAQQQPASPPSVDPPLGVTAAGSEAKEPGLARPAEVAAQGEESSASEAEREAALQSVTGLAFSAPVLDPSLPAA